MKTIALAFISILLSNNASFSQNHLAIPNKDMLSRSIFDSLNMVTSVTSNSILPNEMFVSMTSGVVANISFTFYGISVDAAVTYLEAIYPSTNSTIRFRENNSFAIWTPDNMNFSISVHGGSNQASIAVALIDNSLLKYMPLIKNKLSGD